MNFYIPKEFLCDASVGLINELFREPEGKPSMAAQHRFMHFLRAATIYVNPDATENMLCDLGTKCTSGVMFLEQEKSIELK